MNECIKRIMDLVCSILGLILLSPFMMIIAVAIKWESKGDIIFKQQRVGYHGKFFTIYKFRSMTEIPLAKVSVTSGNDKRITKVGRFIRHYKLDEIPQLWNVLIGQMSLVGPRPEVPAYMQRYSESDKAIILSVKPGITDLTSVKFRHEEEILAAYENVEEAYFKHVLPKKLKYIRFYVKKRNLCFDLKLIAMTVWSIIK